MIKKKQNQASKKGSDPTRAKHAPGRSGDSGPTPFSQFDLALTEYSHAAVLSLARRTKLTSRNVTRACLQFGAAASAALVSGTGVEAAIVYSGPQDIKLTPPVSSASEAFIDLDADGQFDFRFYIYNSGNGPGSSSPLVYGRNAADLIAVTEPFMSAAKRFSFGEQIGTPGSSLGAANTYGSLLWRQNGFVGVQMTNGNFGWIQVTHDHIGAWRKRTHDSRLGLRR